MKSRITKSEIQWDGNSETEAGINYQKQRNGQRVSSTYIGRGDIAGVCATLDAAERYEKEAGRMKEQRERQAFEALDTSIDSLARLSSTLTQAVLIAGNDRIREAVLSGVGGMRCFGLVLVLIRL